MDLEFGGTAYTPPATYYYALGTDTNTSAQRAAGTATEATTGAWTNYARQSVTNNATNFPAASGTTATKSNGAVVNFGTATIPGTAPVITVIYILNHVTNAISATTLEFFIPLTSTQTINNGNVVSVAIGAAAMTLNET